MAWQKNKKTTVPNAFNTGFYGLTTVSSEFQKLMNNILHKTKTTFTSIDDTLIVTKGSKEDHLKKIEETIKVLKGEGIRLKTEKCAFAKTETEWLG